ncbi:MAG: hypothetical protein JW782_06535, partial [Candidatus Saganbacteria bacterium]|nr:hypothetical protein [Candidatus Saganbacteria bacterium]
DNVKSQAELQENIRTLSVVSASLKALNVVVSLIGIVAQGMDSDQSEASERDQYGTHSLSAKPTKGDKDPKEASRESSHGDIFSSIESMEADIFNSEFITMDIHNYSQASVQVAMRHEQMMNQIMDLLVSVPDFATALHDPEDGGVYSNEQVQSEVQMMARSGNVSTTAQHIVDMNDPVRQDMAICGLEAMTSSEVEAQQATNVLEQVAQLAETANNQELLERAEAGLASIQAAMDAQRAETPTVTPAEQQPQTSRMRSEALNALADQIEAQVLSESAEASQQIADLDQEIAQAQQMIEEVNGMQVTDAEVHAMTSAVPDPEQAPVDPQELLQRLEQHLEALRAERSQLVETKNALETELAQAREMAQVLADGAAETEVRELLARHGMDSTLDLENLSRVYQDDADERVSALERQIEATSARMQEIRGELSACQRNITSLRNQIEVQRSSAAGHDPASEGSAESEESAALLTDQPAAARVGQGGGGLISRLFNSWRRTSDDQERIEEASAEQAGVSSRSDEDMLLAISRLGCDSRSPNQRWREMAEGAEYASSHGVSAVESTVMG